MKILTKLLATALLALSVPALSHTGIKTTSPSNEAVLDKAPEQLTLTFRAPVKLMKVTLLKDDKDKIDIGFKPTTKSKSTFEVELSELPKGSYEVEWVSLGGDGHKITGDFSFKVQGEELSPEKQETEEKEKHDDHSNEHKDDKKDAHSH